MEQIDSNINRHLEFNKTVITKVKTDLPSVFIILQANLWNIVLKGYKYLKHKQIDYFTSRSGTRVLILSQHDNKCYLKEINSTRGLVFTLAITGSRLGKQGVDNIWSHKHLADPRCKMHWGSKDNCISVHAQSLNLYLCVCVVFCMSCVRLSASSTLRVRLLIPVGQNISCACWLLPYSGSIDVSCITIYLWVTYPVHEKAFIRSSKHAASHRKVICHALSDVIYISGINQNNLFWTEQKARCLAKTAILATTVHRAGRKGAMDTLT